MGHNTIPDGPWCPECETDEHILEIAGTSIEQLNISNQSQNIYECQQCGATGEEHTDYDTGDVIRKGDLFPRGETQ